MFVRRRPLLRGAMLGGAGFLAGRNAARRAGMEAEQNTRLAELEARDDAPAPAPPASAAPTGSPDLVAELQKLKALMDEGALTGAEFDAAKRKLLGT